MAEAFKTLADPERRRHYDAVGVVVPMGDGSATFGFEGFDFSVESVGGATASTFGDLFADVIHETVDGATDAPRPGADLHVTAPISFDESMHGTVGTVTLVRRDACGACAGSGTMSVAESLCPACRGAGTIRSARGHMVFAKPCGRCGGVGRQRRAACAACGGGGFAARNEVIPVRIPAGIADGDRIRVPAMGHAGTRGGAAGDLYVTVQVAPHPHFRRDGDDLHLIVPVAVHEAALGARFEIPSVDGPVRLRVPPGAQTGQRLRLRERGMPSRRDGQRGDLVVELRIVLPAVLDERTKSLLRAYGELNTDDVRAELWRDTPLP
ncbi:MAG: J domain-containing protein [Acidobacteria bacterium]|nr:J domain-containing protein [Acidobacteriota bacterium]